MDIEKCRKTGSLDRLVVDFQAMQNTSQKHNPSVGSEILVQKQTVLFELLLTLVCTRIASISTELKNDTRF